MMLEVEAGSLDWAGAQSGSRAFHFHFAFCISLVLSTLACTRTLLDRPAPTPSYYTNSITLSSSREPRIYRHLIHRPAYQSLPNPRNSRRTLPVDLPHEDR
jgi:hypothetical protein